MPLRLFQGLARRGLETRVSEILLGVSRRLMHAPCMGCARYAQGAELCRPCAARLAQTPWGVSTLAISDARIPVLWREPYGGPLTDIIYAAKYRSQWASARLLGRCLGELPRPWLGEPPRAVPVPLTAKRLASRGYSQSQLIAAQAARQWGIACESHWLFKSRQTPRQASLPRHERKANLEGSFAGAAGLSGQRIVLIDDIMTSGATLREAVRAVSDAGGLVIAAAVIAKVHDQRPRHLSAKKERSPHVQRRAR